ncbi:MAG: Stk1 family PASTA domain-containing Ser/Thr kinase [Bacilli bacterium]|nr:Stk1 family PASTA domain-containing Ser/Thr kinase [Bacilli bacterium]
MGDKKIIINDRYQIIKTLGEGGMANVFLAYDKILGRNVAVKILKQEYEKDEKFIRRFQREALSASNLSHPNIVEMYDFGEDNGQNYLVMEYVDGKTLKQLIRKRGKLTITEVIDIMLQITDGMSHAHDSYIIHRDIKPQNIMILENGMIKITDFGIAMAINSTQLTQTNSIMGSVHYLPPEQANGKGSTIKSDIYSMGILMYELLTGEIPYKGDVAVEIALKHIKEPLPSIKEVLPSLPQTIENIILKATAKNPKNRYNDAREMHDDIKTALDEARSNESKYVYKYSEKELDETKVLDDALKEVKERARLDEAKYAREIEKEEREENKKQNKILIILVSIFAGLIIITASIILLLPKLMTKKNVEIPDVSALSEVDASNLLTKKGFVINEDIRYMGSDEIEEGYVIKTSPEIGKIVKEGSTITLYVSNGDETFELEDYSGKNYIEVKTILETMYECNIVLEYVTVDEKENKEAESVVKTSPAAGEKVKKGSTVTLYLPQVQKKYPDFTTYTIDALEKFCAENEITVIYKYQTDETKEEGTIIYQSRAKDTVVQPGTTLNITVTTKPKEEPKEEISTTNPENSNEESDAPSQSEGESGE